MAHQPTILVVLTNLPSNKERITRGISVIITGQLSSKGNIKD
jgi:hypothetical protein